MAECPYKVYYSEYIHGDLPPDIDIEFHRHLQDCSVCEREIALFYEVERRLRIRKRPSPEQKLLKAYHHNLKNQIGTGLKKYTVRDRIFDLAFSQSRLLRLGEVFLLLMIGVLIGWIFFYQSGSPDSPVQTKSSYYGKPISKQDMEYLNYYFLASEMVLLEMVNGDVDNEEFFLEKETAQKLLIKTFLVHEVALKLSDPRMLKFLTRMELILYELSNADEDQMGETISSVRYIIEEARLLTEVGELKQLLSGSGTPEKMPG
jgi:hypothetical protein